MPIRFNNQGHFHRTLFAGIHQTVTLLKRDDNQQMGTVTPHKLFNVWHGRIEHTGNTIQGSMNVGDSTIWHIPATELKRVGITYLNPLDRIVDKQGRYWHPEREQMIDSNALEFHTDVNCLRIDPPKVA